MGIGSLVCISNLQIAPAANALMRLGCQIKGTEDFSSRDFLKPGNYHLEKPYLCLVTRSYADN